MYNLITPIKKFKLIITKYKKFKFLQIFILFILDIADFMFISESCRVCV